MTESIREGRHGFMLLLNKYLKDYNYDLSTSANEKELELFQLISKLDLGTYENMHIFYNYVITIKDIPNSMLSRQAEKAKMCILKDIGKLFVKVA